MQNIFSNEVEKSYISETTPEKCRKYAQFFTPYPIARFMAKWVVGGNRTVETILDPAIGLGVFIRAIAEETACDSLQMKGYDLDPEILLKAEDALTHLRCRKNVELICQDYMFNDWHHGYDGIICNPPYFKFQDYETKDDALRELQYRLGMNLSGFTNIYALFLLKSVSQLNPDGRCAYIIPSEFLNADYGTLVKEYLIKLKSLRYIIVFDFDKNIFDEALTTSSILLFANDEQKQGVEFVNVSSEGELEEIAGQLSLYPRVSLAGKYVEFARLNPSVKWRGYYQGNNSEKYPNLVPFSKYARVSRGIATGANDFFLFSKEKAGEFKMPGEYLEPVVSKATQVPGHFFTEDDFNNLLAKNKNVYLLNAKDTHCRAVNDYIASGEKIGIHLRHLTSHRKPWYAIENRAPSPIWVSVFSRGGLRFVRNEAGVRNLTTFHCVYINLSALQKMDLLFSYLLSDISKEIFSDHRREYGDGLEKFEPNDLNRSMIFNLDSIPEKTRTDIIDVYLQYRSSCLSGKPDNSLLDKLNRIYNSMMI